MKINPNPTAGTGVAEVRVTLQRFDSRRCGHGQQGTNGPADCA
ncbi:uncharacterized protein METZ01_LOCUS25377 [marine metagenome]|uniref:Uncharacterized protein n=1 Tax=marine metagenome TaxID=408172 RepID=A0A381Q4J6_9ZZZZ